jgi:hypothetical protein
MDVLDSLGARSVDDAGHVKEAWCVAWRKSVSLSTMIMVRLEREGPGPEHMKSKQPLLWDQLLVQVRKPSIGLCFAASETDGFVIREGCQVWVLLA